MSVHGFSEDESQQLERGKQSSSLESAIGAEGNQAFYFQFIADKEDGAFGELDANHPRTRRARSLTKKKGKRYQVDILLERRKRTIDSLLYRAGNQVAVR